MENESDNKVARLFLWYGLAFVVLLIDQVTKQWISATLSYGSKMVFTSFFEFTLLHNTGAAFSLLSDAGGWQRYFFGIIAATISVLLIVWIWRLPKEERWLACALSFILGGAVGNLYDRFLYGYVIDFIAVHYKEFYFPAFNVADSSICLGAFMMIVDVFRNPHKR